VFGYISVVIEKGVCVMDFRSLGLCKAGIVGWSACDDGVGGRGSLVKGWREWVEKVKAMGDIG
jgi:hypothetical protein